jgi:pyruvate kinase
LDSDPAKGDKNRVQLPHPEIIKASEVGHNLLVDDGKVKLTVSAKGPDFLDCIVEVPGKVKDRKGVNTPDSVLEISPLTPKDRSDLEYMLSIGVDWVALSFVQTPADMDEIHALIDQKLPPGAFKPAVMAKIEKPSCFLGDNLQQIVERCNGIMVARGDVSLCIIRSALFLTHGRKTFSHTHTVTSPHTIQLGVECPPEDVPLLQKQIIDECRQQGRPVVVATQMLESMIECPTPTRAEASDVATAIYDGADAIMLSAESAAGSYPEESVAMQQRIINRVEGDVHYRAALNQNSPQTENTPTDAIITAARQISQNINAKAMVCFSLRGTTISRASKMRPSVPILALCPFKETSRQFALSWGVYPDLPKAGSYGYTVSEEDMFDYDRPMVEKSTDDFDLVLRNACRAALKKGLVSDPEDLLVVTAGLPFGTPGAAVRSVVRSLIFLWFIFHVAHFVLFLFVVHQQNIIRVVPAAGPSCWDGLCRVDDTVL